MIPWTIRAQWRAGRDAVIVLVAAAIIIALLCIAIWYTLPYMRLSSFTPGSGG